MTDEQLFALFFAQSCCIQFHPANHAIDTRERVDKVIQDCADVAVRMLAKHRIYFPLKEV